MVTSTQSGRGEAGGVGWQEKKGREAALYDGGKREKFKKESFRYCLSSSQRNEPNNVHLTFSQARKVKKRKFVLRIKKQHGITFGEIGNLSKSLTS